MTAPIQTPIEPVTSVDSPLPDSVQLALRFAAIEQALALSPPLEERAQLKQEIISLFRDADAAVAHMLAFKESVKALVTQWKQLDGPLPGSAANGATPGAAAGNGAPQVSQRIDHLGASTFIEKGWSRLSLGDAPGAEVALRRALEMAPADNEAATLLGWSQMMQEQYDAALLTFNQVLARDPQHALARTNVGYICLRTQKYGEAIEHLSMAIRIDSDKKATLYSHLYLGMVYREREMFEDAELFFARTLELGPNMLQAWYELGRSRWFAGHFENALAAWRAGANANKFNPWGKRCAEMLIHIEQGGAPPRAD